MSSTEAVKNAMCEAWAAQGTTYKLHDGDPGVAGTDNELSGGGYSPQSTTWGTASGGVITGSQLVYTVLAGDVTHATRWNGATYLGTIDHTDVSVSPAGEVKLTPSYTYPSGAD